MIFFKKLKKVTDLAVDKVKTRSESRDCNPQGTRTRKGTENKVLDSDRKVIWVYAEVFTLINLSLTNRCYQLNSSTINKLMVSQIHSSILLLLIHVLFVSLILSLTLSYSISHTSYSLYLFISSISLYITSLLSISVSLTRTN